MSSLEIGIIGLVALFVFMFLGMPIAVTMGLVGLIGMIFLTSIDAGLAKLALVSWSTTANYILACLPFFILMGHFANVSGLITNSYYAARTWLSGLRGGLAMTTIAGCAIFAACTSSSLACALVMGSISLPEMRRYSYDSRLAAGCVAAGGTLGSLIPPSMAFVLYGIITEQSIGKLFIAGIVPGIVLTALFLLTIYVWTRIDPKLGPAGPKSSWRERLVAFKDFYGIVIMFVAVMGGIYAGVFTPTEAAAAGTLVAVIMTLVNRRMTMKNVTTGFQEALRIAGMIFPIIIGATLFGDFITVSGLGQALVNFVASLTFPAIVIMILIMLLFIILGMFMDSIAMMVLLVPILVPVVKAMGFDLIWYGVFNVILIEMGQITPPVGMVVFGIAGIAKAPMYTIFAGIWPFFGAMCVMMVLLLAFPQIVLALPNIMMK